MQNTVTKIGIISLGCSKALVETESFAGGLRSMGYIFTADLGQADIVIVNTCGFLDSAKAESIKAITDASESKAKIIVCGCLTTSDPEAMQKLQKKIPSIVEILGPNDPNQIIEAVVKINNKPFNPKIDLIENRYLLTPNHYAYLKISEGCNHKCRFCIIPKIRGSLISRPLSSIMDEAAMLADKGVKELIVIAQDTGAYGKDLKHANFTWRGKRLKSHILDLAPALAELGIWVRLLYLYPYPFLDELLPMMSSQGLLPYFDMPLQHASKSQLRAMRRPQGGEKMLERIANWRKVRPDICIRSTFMVGFPEETEEDFQELITWLSQAKLDRVGSFQYENISGAAAVNDPQVEKSIKVRRQAELMKAQEAISLSKSTNMIGKTIPAMLDEINDQEIVCRSYREAPEVDGKIFIDKKSLKQSFNSLKLGDQLKVKITKSDIHDLVAEAVI